jgi:hypothetical protein
MRAASVVGSRQGAAERLGEKRRVPDLDGEPDGGAALAREIGQHLADELTDRLVDLPRFGEVALEGALPAVPARAVLRGSNGPAGPPGVPACHPCASGLGHGSSAVGTGGGAGQLVGWGRPEPVNGGWSSRTSVWML